MLINIIKTYTQKVFLPCWVVLIVIIFLDISTRLTHMETKQNSPWKVVSEAKNEMFTLNQEQAEKITMAIDNYDTTATAKITINNGMSNAEQLAQQGNLHQLFAGNLRYRLVGIFDKKERFAVIQQLDTSVSVDKNEDKLIKVSVTESLQDYEITKIFANKVTLNSNDNRQINLFLYKKLDKSN